MIETAATSAVAVVRGVSHRYGALAALNGVDFEIRQGQLIGLIGPDGVGKSTLLGLIAGARAKQSGAINVFGGDIGDPAHRRRVQKRIAYMPQGLGKNLYPELSVAEHVEFFAALWGLDQELSARRSRLLLAATGLLQFADRAMGNLSGGMKQKLGLCCALVHEPDFLILDEPTTGIDPLSRRQFWELIASLRARRPDMSVLVASAYLREAMEFDRIVAMVDGRIVAAGTARAIMDRTATESLDAAYVRLMAPEAASNHVPAAPPPRPLGGVPAIEAQGLTRRFGDFLAVESVDLKIAKGEIFGFIGSNGCGKTTTIKMLAGLLRPSAGVAKIFGHTPDAADLGTRRRIGYMSQSFSLYEELTVMQNLHLHARLYQLPGDRRQARVQAMVRRFELEGYANADPKALPLGVRQRLSLAVALIHEPELLILDEPTSGVDPVARERFWSHLEHLARDDGVTIFLSTHFMNEAERCDRVSLMHAGRILATGAPAELAAAVAAPTLEDAFIAYLDRAEPRRRQPATWDGPVPSSLESAATAPAIIASFRRARAYAVREARELSRDAIRLSFALLGPIFLMLTFGFGISFDVENLPFAVLDMDNSRESRDFLDPLRGSRYFVEKPDIVDVAQGLDRMKSGEIVLSLEIPPGFGRDLLSAREAEAAIWLDGAMPYRAETARGYLEGVIALAAQDNVRDFAGDRAAVPPYDVEPRMRYNQSFESVVAIVPGIIMLLLILIPAMMTALGVVREKEIGTITNFYATPVTRLEFLIGKQTTYCLVAMTSFLTLWLTARWVFGVEMRGSAAAFVLGAGLFVLASTAFGLLVSSFVRSQMAAIFATAIIAMIPTVSFSGFLDPISSLNAAGRWFGRLFPASYFQHISIGTMVKGLGLADLWSDFLALLAFAIVFLGISRLLLRKQER